MPGAAITNLLPCAGAEPAEIAAAINSEAPAIIDRPDISSSILQCVVLNAAQRRIPPRVLHSSACPIPARAVRRNAAGARLRACVGVASRSGLFPRFGSADP